MENVKLNQRVKKTTHEARKCRRKGMVPGVLYGRGVQNLLFEIGELELNDIFSKEGQHGVLNVQLDGNSYDALVKEVQRDPVTRKVIHVDLESIDRNQTIVSSVPIQYVGEEYIIKHGSVLQKDRDSIKVECKPSELPKFINIDVSHAQVGDQFRISDVEFATELSIVDDIDTVLASVSFEQKIPEDVDIENGIMSEKQEK